MAGNHIAIQVYKLLTRYLLRPQRMIESMRFLSKPKLNMVSVKFEKAKGFLMRRPNKDCKNGARNLVSICVERHGGYREIYRKRFC